MWPTGLVFKKKGGGGGVIATVNQAACIFIALFSLVIC